MNRRWLRYDPALEKSRISAAPIIALFASLPVFGQITAINPASSALLCLPPADGGSGRVLTEAFPREPTRPIDGGLHAALSGSFREIKTEIDGTVPAPSVAASLFLSPQSAKIGIIVVIFDVTHEKELEKKLELSSRMAAMREMVAGVAHQIRNPRPDTVRKESCRVEDLLRRVISMLPLKSFPRTGFGRCAVPRPVGTAIKDL